MTNQERTSKLRQITRDIVRTYRTIGGINRIGTFMGPAVGGILAAVYGLRAPFWLFGLLAIIALSLGLFGMGEFASGKWGLVGWLLLFFTAFNLLEASLPSLISKIAPADAKGTAMGVYSTSQFAGAFFGGAAGGWIHQQFGAQAVLLFGAGMAVLWLLFAAGMRAPEPLKPRLVNIRNMPGSSSEISELFHRIAGVREVVIAPDEGVAYLKVDSKKLDEEALEAMEASA